MQIGVLLTEVKGIGPALSQKLRKLGVETINDLVNYYPRRYNDYSDISKINAIKPGIVTIKAEIKQAKGRYVRRGLHITEAVASDDSGSVRLVWFNQPYRAAALKQGVEYYISGQYGFSYQRLSIVNSSVELVSAFPLSTARIVPVYSETKGLKSHQIRKAVKQIIPLIHELPESLPTWLLEEHHLLERAKSIEALHFPKDPVQLKEATRRLGFEEVFELSLASLLNKHELQSENSPKVTFNEKLAKEFVAHLPFKLTDAQRKVTWRIYQDMEYRHPMNRLLEGDVGSGKTVVATMAALMAIEQNYQVAIMAPTELLARQHAETIHNLLQPLGYSSHVGLLVGSMTLAQKQTAREKIRSGEVRLIIGTHTLIQQEVDMHNLVLIVIDEQHRFGVEQRKKLQAKAGHMPHVLHMTATPIPRSLALTLYGELDISVLDEKPSNRQQIITKICSPNSRANLNESIKKQLSLGRQMFVVCPLITESDSAIGSSVEKVYQQIKNDFPEYQSDILHGKLPSKDKTKAMKKFVEGKTSILVSTTVVEVGVDVPNATVMLIESAERFGLAQIHQLRGRVGRSSHRGYCYLMLSDSKAPTKRMQALESSSDGFQLAELDLEIRGPGAIYGTMQHGQLDLRIAKLTDAKLISQARNSAQKFISKNENLKKYPHLSSRVTKLRAITNLN